MAEPGITIKVEGLAELQKALQKFPKDWTKIATQALKPGMAKLETESKKVPPCPKDTGVLSASIGSEIVKGPGSVIMGKVGSNVDYASYQEYGTSKMAAQPYLRPTLKKYKDRVIKMFEKGIAKALKRLGL